MFVTVGTVRGQQEEADIVDYVRTIKELEAKIRTKEGMSGVDP